MVISDIEVALSTISRLQSILIGKIIYQSNILLTQSGRKAVSSTEIFSGVQVILASVVQTITSTHIMEAIRDNVELSALFPPNKVIFGGTVALDDPAGLVATSPTDSHDAHIYCVDFVMTIFLS